MKIFRTFVLSIILVFTFAIEASPEALAIFEAKTYINQENDTLLYRMLEPQNKCF